MWDEIAKNCMRECRATTYTFKLQYRELYGVWKNFDSKMPPIFQRKIIAGSDPTATEVKVKK